MDKRIITTLILIQAFGLSVIGFAAREPNDREPAAVNRMQARDIMQTTTVTGSLACQLKAENTGEACTLKITAQDSGRIYEITGSKTAMRLYQDGTRNVRVEGKTRGPYLIVNKIEALDTLQQ